MYCNQCGTEINENQRFCPQCGKVIAGEETHVTEVSSHVGPMANTTSALVWGIVGLGFSCSFFLSFLGIIFSVVGLKKCNAVQSILPDSTKAKTGHAMSKAGIIVGIILTILFLVWLFVVIAALSGRYTSYHRYY